MISMIRTVISIDPDEKSWLERQAKSAGVPMSELVREAIRRMRRQEDASFDRLLEETSGLWTEGDGLDFQRRSRAEWR